VNEYNQVRYWVEELPKRGRTTFTLKEAEDQFSEKPSSSVRRALARLSDTGKVHSVWRGFYAISLPEYGLEGIAPPIDYIDQLMRYLGKKYYVALLTAASFSGASHQAPQSFYVICNSNLHVKDKNGVKLEPVYKKKMPDKYISEINSRTASVRISTPELTAIDLVVYMKRAGGINHVATVLSELADSVDFRRVDTNFFNGVSSASVQRLGYLLDETLGEKDAADHLYEKAKQVGIKFKFIPLVIRKESNMPITNKNSKWRIDVNYEVESDI
jgi:predicted transcriptional regulator of viral defense system